jgi:hypothetical protein
MLLRSDLEPMPSSAVDTRLRGHDSSLYYWVDSSFYPGHSKGRDSQVNHHITHCLPRFHSAVGLGNLVQRVTRPDAVLQLVFRQHV